MKLDTKGIQLIKDFEGCKLTAYRDVGGTLTIGIGHTGKDVKVGMSITNEKALELFKKDVAKFEKHVDSYNKIYNFNQNQFNALVSFAYNIGNIDQLTKNGKRTIEEISKKILSYTYCNGKYSSGLYNRRRKEQHLFNEPVYSKNDVILTCKAKSGLYIRATNSMNGKVIGAIPYGDKVVKLDECSNGWLMVSYLGVNGYSCGGWLE